MNVFEYDRLEKNIFRKFNDVIGFMDYRLTTYEDSETKVIKSFWIELESNYEMELYYELSDDLECYEASRRHSTIKLKGNPLKDLNKLIKDLELVRDVSDYVIEKCPFPIRI